MSVRADACSTVIAQMLRSASTSMTVFSSRSRVSATGRSLNSMNKVSVLVKGESSRPESLRSTRSRSQATFRDRDVLTTNRTTTPSLASMSISASVLNKSIRPLKRSLTRGWVTRRILAASACLRPRDSSVFCSWIRRSARTSRCSDSSAEKPTSRKTFPLDGVILVFGFLGMTPLPQFNKRVESLLPSIQVPLSGLLRLLCEGVKNIDAFVERRDVEHPMRTLNLDSDLANAGAHFWHRLPIERVESLLNSSQLKASQTTNRRRERANITSRRSEPDQGLVGHVSIIRFIQVFV